MFAAPVVAAAEISGTQCTLLVSRRLRRALPEVIAQTSLDLTAPDAASALRTERRAAHWPARVSVILWPAPEDPGVVPIDQRQAEADFVMPRPAAIRDRVRPLIQAGFRVRRVFAPHDLLGELAADLGASAAVFLVLNRTGGCLARVEPDGRIGRPTYLAWPVDSTGESGRDRPVWRYQFAARLAPHVREMSAAWHGAHVFACGTMPDLRAVVVPLIEELDREIDILDAALPGMGGEAPRDPAAVQLLAAAARHPVRERARARSRILN